MLVDGVGLGPRAEGIQRCPVSANQAQEEWEV